MSQKSVNGSYWQTPPSARNQILLIPVSLEERIPDKHPVRLLDEILDGLDWTVDAKPTAPIRRRTPLNFRKVTSTPAFFQTKKAATLRTSRRCA